MKINGKYYPTLSIFHTMMTVPDCIVTGSNKLGRGHGESKFYICSKKEMHSFYGKEGFTANCFMMKSDLIAYMTAIKNEYLQPSQNYAKKDKFPLLWSQRMETINKLDNIIPFKIKDQNQIIGPRGYINSTDPGYQIIREIALPLVSYIYVEKIGTEENPLFYWKLFVDFDAIWQKQNVPLVFNYGRTQNQQISQMNNQIKNEKNQTNIRKARDGQGKYREQLLEQCRFCPITMIADERLLIASHIKPWCASSDEEKIDPYNGFMLSPMIDKLFDRGFITFTFDRRIVLSDFISQYTWKQIGLKNNTFYSSIPMDDNRKKYLEFHHQSVFKGTYQE